MNAIKKIRWQLVAFDVLTLLLVDLLLLGIYGGFNNITHLGATSHFVVNVLCVTISRIFFGVYRQIWRYGGIQAYMRLLFSDAVAFVVNYIIVRVLPFQNVTFPLLLSIISINLLGALSIRMLYRYSYKCANSETPMGRFLLKLLALFAGKKIADEREIFINTVKVAVVGAGRLGITLADDLMSNPMSNYRVEYFIDINSSKVGRTINEIPVITANEATISRLRDKEVSEVIIAIASLSDSTRKYLYSYYKDAGFKVKVYDFPTMHTANDKRQLREFDVEELLFRKPVIVNDDKTASYYEGKTILITGGGGSIGSEICRQLVGFNPSKLVILDNYENGAYEVQQEIKAIMKSSVEVAIEIVSICNNGSLERVFATYKPDIVVMAAAHKHVPLMENNVIEAIENNIFGTLNTIELSVKYEASRVIMVSTDKAVNPTNVMGATKRFCEMIVGSYSKLYDEGKIKTTFSSTRFGNVLGSAGSVIPLFKKQIANGGPVTVTDKRIIRYFMTIPEASQLVLQSGAMANNGELFVLDMGQPVKIYELARNLIELSGYVPEEDIKIVETGLRPGEKLYEELLMKSDTLTKTSNELIFIEKDTVYTIEEINGKINLLTAAVNVGDELKAREALRSVVPTFVKPSVCNGAG